jgi:hypothetical protein
MFKLSLLVLLIASVLPGCASAPHYEPGAGSHSGQDFRLPVTVCRFAYCADSREQAQALHNAALADKSK